MKVCMNALLGAVLLVLFFAGYGWSEDRVLKMSTTTSTQSSGLLDILLPEFKKDSGIKIKVIAKGTGAAIRDGKDGNVDVIFVHAKDRETAFVADGFGTARFPVMYNDFVLLGPAEDPAGIKGIKDVAMALGKIAKAKEMFVSRGDDSGTHTKEQALWAASGVDLMEVSQTIIKKGKESKVSLKRPANSDTWYVSIGQGMGKVITYADEKQAYTLADRGTYIKYKFGRNPAIALDVLNEGDANLANPYGIIPVNPKKHPHVQYEMAMEFVDWITGERGQKLIADYRLEGKQLFYPQSNRR
ncbi:MAG: substrate-binding domain-containing protein [Desulfocapsa sp.]|uniref:Substrate-binding domain-containing protein n=1 Tax=Desulfotalea psychrophila TaxID=84980 RepID=A0ABS3AVF6_9BACT|nr:substrate-binding domain-containing protein [Desulfocapsa sp.]MBN4048821.1 substrate-binding domain-containing protein [bacterium AH-315-N22]MBN4068783.1 substrate-binding domain-containing protein [Desulfotalea psychrophila]